MLTDRPLRLYEEILLLELDDDKGTTGMESWCKTEMGGAILAELVMTGAIGIGSDKKKRVRRLPGAPKPADPILAEAFALIAEAKKPKKAGDWVQKFASMKDLRNRAARQLVDKGVLKEETGKVLVIFKRTIFPEYDPGPEQELRRRMEEAIFSSSRQVDPETTVIIALARATGLLKKIFPKKRLKARKQRLDDLAKGHLVGDATREAMEAVQAAIVVCTIMPAIAASTVTTTT
jgi:hypothetical protein